MNEPARALSRRTLLALLAGSACRRGAPSPAPRQRLAIATGPKGGVYHPLGEALAALCNERLAGVDARAFETAGSVANVQKVQDGDVDVAFAQADAAYEAHAHAPGVSALRAVAVLYTNALQIVTARRGAAPTVASLLGRRVGIGPRGSNTERVASIVLEAHGVAVDRVDRRSLGFEEAAALVTAGGLDAAFVMASYPADAIVQANAGGAVRLLSLESALMNDLRGRHPFYRPILIPRGTYAGQSDEVHTLGVDNLLVCHAALPADLVQDLTGLLLSSLPELARAHPSAGTIDPEQAPSTPIPLHAGAARFYRKREILR